QIAAADLVAGLCIVVLGAAGIGSKVIHLVPLPILMGMFGASILEYETRMVNSISAEVWIAAPMVAAYVAGRWWNHRQVPPVGLAVVAGGIAIAVLGKAGHLEVHSALPTLEVTSLDFSFKAILSVTVPMVVLVLGLGNVQSLGFMISEGYETP